MMSLEEQVDREFTAARRRAWMHGLISLLLRRTGTGCLREFESARRTLGASGGVRRGRSTVEVSRIVGSLGKHEQFDEGFMPLRGMAAERWKSIDRAFRLGIDLPPVILYKLGDDYFVQDGHHRVSVARFHRVEYLDAEVTEFRLPEARTLARAQSVCSGAEPSPAC